MLLVRFPSHPTTRPHRHHPNINGIYSPLTKMIATAGSFAIASDPHPRIINLDFPALPSGKQRASKLQENDVFLSSILDLLSTSKYTVIYITTPYSEVHKAAEDEEPEMYEMDTSFSAPQEHMGVKRDFVGYGKREEEEGSGNQNVTLVDAALFEKYQFFTPGMFSLVCSA